MIYSQSRGINIPIESITKLQDGAEIKKRYWTRKGFAKAYGEMRGAMAHIMTRFQTKLAIEIENTSSPINNKNNSKKPKPTQCNNIETRRRSARIHNQIVKESLVVVRRSARIEQQRALIR